MEERNESALGWISIHITIILAIIASLGMCGQQHVSMTREQKELFKKEKVFKQWYSEVKFLNDSIIIYDNTIIPLLKQDRDEVKREMQKIEEELAEIKEGGDDLDKKIQDVKKRMDSLQMLLDKRRDEVRNNNAREAADNSIIVSLRQERDSQKAILYQKIITAQNPRNDCPEYK